jgi:ribokinase
MTRITVVGSFAVGMTLRAPRFPVAGETLIAGDFDMGPGGKGSNQAVGAARLGVESHFVGMIGNDTFGDMAIDLYQEEGVHTGFLRRTPARNTGVGFITLNAAGDNHIVLDPGANELLSPEDVDAAESLIASSDVVLTVLEIPSGTAARAMELARRHNVTALLNPAPAAPLPDETLAQVDVLTPNAGELRVLLGLDPENPTSTLDLARQVQARGARNVVATLGSQGALILHEGGDVERVEGVSVDVTDTTGAGDAFSCALTEAVRFATAAGALACTRLGVIPALPYRSDVERLLNQ